MKQITIITVLIFIGCCFATMQDGTTLSATSLNKLSSQDSVVYLKKHVSTGDFDGDGKFDTIFQNVIDAKTKQQIDYFPSNQWDSIENYFSRIEADIILTVKNQKYDTLHLGSGGGLFCLINLGDNNKDNKDEIALVVDNYGFTNISTCKIYTLCNTQWIELKSFKIHESAFDFEGENIPDFKKIKGFFEYRKSKWFYIDYEDWFNAETDKDTTLIPLKIKSGC